MHQVPNLGDRRRLPQDKGGRVLVHNAYGVQLLSNVCRHRKELTLGGETGDVGGAAQSSGNLAATGGNIVRPLHRWTYDAHGALIGAPELERKPCRNLEYFGHGLLYEGPREAAKEMVKVFGRPDFDFSGYVLVPYRNAYVPLRPEDFYRGLSGGPSRCTVPSWARKVRDLRGPRLGVSGYVQHAAGGVHNALTQPGSDIYQMWPTDYSTISAAMRPRSARSGLRTSRPR